ncbi:MAG: hypothetical protein SFZ03_04755 [Candidatus Melainabacteria bacterium]|nr:hypothetical protein [Candidatus Melainabacteria bacterium]
MFGSLKGQPHISQRQDPKALTYLPKLIALTAASNAKFIEVNEEAPEKSSKQAQIQQGYCESSATHSSIVRNRWLVAFR